MEKAEYNKLYNNEKILSYIADNSYKDNLKLYNEINTKYKDLERIDYSRDTIIDLKIMLNISKKYNYDYNVTKDIITNLTNINSTIQFHIANAFLQYLKIKTEKAEFLDHLIECSKTNWKNKASITYVLEDAIKMNYINKNKYKKVLANIYKGFAEESSGLQAEAHIKHSLRYYKELNLKEEYEEALLIHEKNAIIALNEMNEIKIPVDYKITNYMNNNNSLVKDIFKNTESITDIISFICNFIFFWFEGEVEYKYRYSPFVFSRKKEENTGFSFTDLCDKITYKGNKFVKNTQISTVDSIEVGLEKGIHMISEIVPAVEGIIENKVNKEEFVKEIIDSEIIFEEDKKHINKALNLFFNSEFDLFIYVIIPNFEKILRNVLTINGLPTYVNMNTDSSIQTTLNLSETIKKLKEKELLHKDLIIKIEETLNDEESDNYRNRLSHREDEELFCKETAYSLFVLLIQLIKGYSNKSFIIHNFVLDNKDN